MRSWDALTSSPRGQYCLPFCVYHGKVTWMMCTMYLITFLQHRHVRVVFDPTYPEVGMHDFIKIDWKPMYGDVKEAVPLNGPVACGKAMDLHMYIDSDNDGEKFTRRP
jgi:hypothetical protein